MPVIILAGEEEYQIGLEARTLKDKLVDPAWESFNFARMDNPDLKDVIDAAATVPFGLGNKMVLVDRCSLFTKKRASQDSDGSKDKSAAKLIDDFDAGLASIAPNTYLVFSCIANFDKTLKVSKAAEKHAKIQIFERIKYYAGAANNQFISFCHKHAHRFGAVIDDDAAAYLAESTEVNLRQVVGEIEKAATYILPNKRITLADVILLSPHFSDVFVLMEHWALKHKDKTLASVHELRSRQVPAPVVFAAVSTVLTKWIAYKTEYETACAQPAGGRDVRRKEVPLKELAMKIDARMAFMIEKDLRKIKNLSLDYLVAKKMELTELETLFKTGEMPESHALEVFFTR